MKKIILTVFIILFIIALGVAVFTIFYDQAVLVRRDTVYVGRVSEKVVALTFDDGPSPVWTPQILDVLKKGQVKATFFMLGEHVVKYPEVAKRVAAEGHEIENHTYDHHVLIYYTMEELEKEVKEAEKTIKEVTGQATRYFRPPKAWLTAAEKKKLEEMGYKTVLWTLNSKDWVTFDDKYIIRYILKRVQPGDIILFHDSGGVFKVEGGDRHETVLAVGRLIEGLKERGYRFVTIKELLELDKSQ